jgi:hypothetical protein
VTHFTDLELRMWRDAGAADQARIAAHVAECPGCAARYAESLLEARPLEDAADGADFLDAGLRAGPSPRERVPSPDRARWLIGLAAAAAVALAVLVPRWTTLDRGDGAALRGGTIRTVSPSGLVDAVGVALVWETPVLAEKFRIEIGDANGVVHSGDATGSRYVVPREVADRLRSGVDYWWTVAALDSSGAVVLTSERRRFAIKTP